MTANSTLHPTIYSGPFTSVGTVILLIGVLTNSMVIGATVRKNSQLRNKCNYLICILAIIDLLTCISLEQIHILFWIHWLFIPNRSCFYVSILQLFLTNFGAFMVLTVALDRVFMLAFPVWYQLSGNKEYIIKMVIPGVIFSLVLLLLGFNSTTDDIVPYCVAPRAFTGRAAIVWVMANLLLSLLVIITNIVAVMLSKKHDNEHAETDVALAHMRRSIALVGFFYCFMWVSLFLALIAFSVVDLSVQTRLHLELYLGFGHFINVSINGIIYWCRSSAYKNEFLKLLGLQSINVVQPSGLTKRGHNKSCQNQPKGSNASQLV